MSSKGGKVKESQGERELGNITREQWKDYKNRFVPLETHYLQTLEEIRDDRPLATGMAAGDVAQAYDPAIESVRSAQFSNDITPNSGRSTVGLANLYASRADAASKATAGADQTTEDRYWAGQNQAIALGQGQQSTANVGFRAGAGLDAAEAISEARADGIREYSKYNALGTVAGVGAAYGLDELAKRRAAANSAGVQT